jgi:hypothetical protein
MQWPRNRDEFLDIVDQTIFEVDDLVASAADEGDEDDLGQYVPVYQQIATRLRVLRQDVLDGRHRFADGTDLEVLTFSARWKAHIPVFSLLETLNAAHRRGVE